MNQRLLDEKRYEISAQHFGKSVYTFYLDTLISRHNKETKKLSLYLNRTEKSSSIKLVQGAIHLPKKAAKATALRSEEHTSELQSRQYLVCRLLLEKKKKRQSKLYSDVMTQPDQI